MSPNTKHRLAQGVVVAISLAFLYLATMVYASGRPLLALAIVAGTLLSAYVFFKRRLYAYRYVYPGLLTMAVFLVFPIVYTVWIGFTNYSSSHILTFERAKSYFLEQTYATGEAVYPYTLHRGESGYRLRLEAPSGEAYVTEPTPLPRDEQTPLPAQPAGAGGALPEALGLRQLIAQREALRSLNVALPDGTELRMAKLRSFAPIAPRYRANDDGTLTDLKTGTVLTPDFETGFFRNAEGEAVPPGFRVAIGIDNYERVFTEPAFREPFVKIFAWTVTFAGLTVLFATAIGMVLAVILSWEALRFRGLYRLLLFLPYAVPGFISILVFKGLFNENFGEINLILNALFGIKPSWFTDPMLARTMILMVNIWLGYPYIMVLCMGLLKAIPHDIYEASALAGVGPVRTFTRVTFPLLMRPLTPLLIAAFAFNFNNFVLIELLTSGRPDFLGTQIPAGTTDILVTYTYRIAFEDSGKNFGLAAAVSTVIFAMVALLALVNLRVTRAGGTREV